MGPAAAPICGAARPGGNPASSETRCASPGISITGGIPEGLTLRPPGRCAGADNGDTPGARGATAAGAYGAAIEDGAPAGEGGSAGETGGVSDGSGVAPDRGMARNISLASRARISGSRGPAPPLGSLVLMVSVDRDVVENRQRVLRQHGQGAIERDQIGRDRLVVDAHEAHGKAEALLAGQVRLEESHYSLPYFSRAHEQDVGLLGRQGHLVRRHQGDPAPGQELGAEERDRGRRHAAPRRLPPERRDGGGMGQEERGLLPDLRQELVEVVRSGWTAAGLDLLPGRHVVEEPVLLVVDELALLALLDRLDDEAQLLADLVVGAAVEVRDPGVHVEDGRDRRQHVLARVLDVVDEGLRQDALVPGRAIHLDGG